MTCQICEAKSGFYPLCKECFKLKDAVKITKCEECGIWKKDTKPLCYECYLKNKKNEEKKSKDYKPSKFEQEDTNFRNKFPAEIRCEDGHKVRSKSEKIIDDWLYNHKIAHAYERKVPIEEDVYCDFFLPYDKKVWIEFWGLDDEKYIARKELKKKFYTQNNKILIEISEKDIEILDDILPKKLMPYLPKDFNLD